MTEEDMRYVLTTLEQCRSRNMAALLDAAFTLAGGYRYQVDRGCIADAIERVNAAHASSMAAALPDLSTVPADRQAEIQDALRPLVISHFDGEAFYLQDGQKFRIPIDGAT
jgi:hypothetical protein